MKRAVDPEGERKPTTFTSLPWKNDCVHRHEQVDASDKRLPVRKKKQNTKTVLFHFFMYFSLLVVKQVMQLVTDTRFHCFLFCLQLFNRNVDDLLTVWTSFSLRVLSNLCGGLQRKCKLEVIQYNYIGVEWPPCNC